MVVLAASICTKSGKPLISRQFHPLTRSRLESLLLSFPKLLSPSSQHTTLTTSEVRYVYQPLPLLEDLYLILITNLASNILQDIDTLKLFVRVVGDLLRLGGGMGAGMERGGGEREVKERAFDLLTAFDEIISLGYRENVSLVGVRGIIEMESHEEKIQEIIARNKEQEAKEELKRRAKQLEMQRREMQKRGQTPYGSSGMGGGGSGGFDRSYQPVQQQSYQAPQSPPIEDRFGSGPSSGVRPFKSKGMQLGAPKSSNNLGGGLASGGARSANRTTGLLDAMRNEVGDLDDGLDYSGPAAAAAAPPSALGTPQIQSQVPVIQKEENPFGPVDQESVHLVVREKLTLELSHEGGLKNLELSGSLDLRISDPAFSKITLTLNHADGFSGSELQFKTHPNVDKKRWTEDKKVALRDRSKNFPVGQGLGVLKWRLATKDETIVPLAINCWPSPSDDGNCDVNIEYELQAENLTLKNVIISIPLPPGQQPTINSCEGTANVNHANNTLEWHIPEIDPSNSSGLTEFTVQSGGDTEVFFPIAVDFVSNKGLCGVEVNAVADETQGGADTPFSVESLMVVDEYVIT